MIKMSDLNQINVPRYTSSMWRAFGDKLQKGCLNWDTSQIIKQARYQIGCIYSIFCILLILIFLDKIIQVQKIKVVENKEEKDEVIIIKNDLLK